MSNCLLKWCSLTAVSFLYFRYLTLPDPVIKLPRAGHTLAEETHRSTSPLSKGHHHSHGSLDKIVLTEEEEADLIKEYSRMERKITVKPGCAIGAGYTTCMDIIFRAVDMFQAMEKEFQELLRLQGGKLVP